MTTETVLQPERVVVGNCPDCGRVLVVLNNHESWPLASCDCDWTGATTDIVNRARRERGWARTRRVYVKPGRAQLVHLPVGTFVGVESVDQQDGALIVLPPDDTSAGETTSWLLQWVLPGAPNTDLIKRTLGTWGEARLCELEAF